MAKLFARCYKQITINLLIGIKEKRGKTKEADVHWMSSTFFLRRKETACNQRYNRENKRVLSLELKLIYFKIH